MIVLIQKTGYKSSDGRISLTPPILCPIMHPIQNKGKRRHIIKKSVEMFDRIRVGRIQPEPSQNLLMHLSVGNISELWKVC